MTLPQNGKKLTKIEEESMEIALKEAGIVANSSRKNGSTC